jgi:gliding motility-associated-like protein
LYDLKKYPIIVPSKSMQDFYKKLPLSALVSFFLKALAFLFLLSMAWHTAFSQRIIHGLNQREIDSIQMLQLIPVSATRQGTHTHKPLFSFKPLTVNKVLRQNLILKSATLPASSCKDTSSRFFLKNDSCEFFVDDYIWAHDGTLLIAGEYIEFADNFLYSKGFLMKCTQDGNVLWNRLYDSVNSVNHAYTYYYRLLEKADGSIILAGGTYNFDTGNNDLILTKTDNSGNLTWSKVFKSRLWGHGSGSTDYYYVQQIKEDPQSGNFFITGPHWTEGRSVSRIDDSNGNIIWSKLYQPPFENFFDCPFGMDIQGNEIWLFGRFLTNYDQYISIYRLDKATGDTIQSRFFSFQNTTQKAGILGLDQLSKLNNGNYILHGCSYGYYRNPYDPTDTLPFYHAGVIQFDNKLNFLNAFSFRNNTQSNNSNTKVSVFSDGSGLFTMLKYISGYTAQVFYVQFKGSTIVKQRIRNYSAEGIPNELKSLPLGNGTLTIKLIGDSVDNSTKIEFLKLHPTDASSECLGTEDHSTFTTPFSLLPVQGYIDSIGDHVFQEGTNKTMVVKDASLAYSPGCQQRSFCDSLSVSSPVTQICVSDSLLIKVHKNPECGAPVFFNLDSSHLESVIPLNDSLFCFKFNSSWTGTIYANTYGCKLLQDSIKVSVLESPKTLNLGSDSVLCAGQKISLHAGSGFASYSWNDGTFDSTLSVTSPGQYFVHTTNACGGNFRDSIMIQPPCDSFSVSSSSAGFCVSDSMMVTIHKSPQCHGPAYFNFDSTYLQSFVQVNDSAYRFRFYAAWRGTIYAHTYGCSLLSDSINVSVVDPATALDLGPDTVLCPGNTIKLHAGSGFSGYLWNNGSSDSVLLVSSVGKYFVKTNNACGGIFTDTLIVSNHPAIPFDIGPDLSKCNLDSIDITLPDGFISYLWIPAYAISSDTSRSVVLAPLKTTTYKVQAEKSPGCFAYDSIRVTVKMSPQIDLGSDQSFCLGDSLFLDAGPGFATYVWNTGSSFRELVANKKGEYSVVATTADGCRSSDTINVKEVYPNPVVTLDKNPALCKGEVRQLNAGAFNSYEWNTGEKTESIQVSKVGLYFVKVIDVHGCSGSDTTDITMFLPLPEKFLPPDTAVCSYGSVDISSLNNYSNYLWSTGATDRNISLTDAGTYWLQVTDKTGCVGRDTIEVLPKDCMAGFYIPNAFSPNGDGVNDNFKPLLFGRVLHFQFTIYNNFGQIVFQTNRLTESWDGNYKTNPQDSHVFVWTCKYQFSGEKEQLKKGTVLLVR